MQEKLDKIIKLHDKWLNDEDGGKRAGLHHANLTDADLGNADLTNADLTGADLTGANLTGADLSFADLSFADLTNADLTGADLTGANLTGADLKNARLNWISWHEACGLKLYIAGLNSSRENAQLVYIPSLDVATTGCWQSTWEATKQRVANVYKDKDKSIYHKYQLAFKYIEDQMEADK